MSDRVIAVVNFDDIKMKEIIDAVIKKDDLVPVIRCKDCVLHTDVEPYDWEDELIPSNAVFCQHFEVIRDKEWFCADGARR